MAYSVSTRDHEAAKAERAGYDAAENGYGPQANPYPPESPLNRAWRAGWRSAYGAEET